MIRDYISTISEKFKSGTTMTDLGKEFGCSRERIRQLLTEHGVSTSKGGIALTRSRKKQRASEEKDARYLKKYGCTFKQYKSLSESETDKAKSPLCAFRTQKNHADRRGVKWNLKLWDWWTIWRRSGKWEQRGCGKEKYCMCRIGDQGAYEIGNVYIDTATNNSVLGRTLAWERGRKQNQAYRMVDAAGGRTKVAEALGVTPMYVSVVCGNNRLPESWFEDGKIETLLEMGGCIFSREDAAKATFSYQKEAAQ